MIGFFSRLLSLWLDIEWITQEDNITILGCNFNAGENFIEFTVGILGIVLGFAIGSIPVIEELKSE